MGAIIPLNSTRPQAVDHSQDFSKQVPRHGNLGGLEREGPAMADNLGSNLDPLLP